METCVTSGWIFTRDVVSDLVVSGTIEDTPPIGVQIVDRIELAASTARIRVDRVFQVESVQNLRFKWFTFQCSTKSGGFYSGPRPACFRPQKRYLIFLRRDTSGWVVALPLYGIEIQLAPALPSGAFRDLSHASIQRRFDAIAEELEMAASLLPLPGSTGEAATYFSEAFDLIGGCAEPFYRSFLFYPPPVTSCAGQLSTG